MNIFKKIFQVTCHWLVCRKKKLTSTRLSPSSNHFLSTMNCGWISVRKSLDERARRPTQWKKSLSNLPCQQRQQHHLNDLAEWFAFSGTSRKRWRVSGRFSINRLKTSQRTTMNAPILWEWLSDNEVWWDVIPMWPTPRDWQPNGNVLEWWMKNSPIRMDWSTNFNCTTWAPSASQIIAKSPQSCKKSLST